MMLGSGVIYVSMVLAAIASLVPMIWGISKTRGASDFGAVSLLALWVYVGQLALYMVVAFILTGKAATAVIYMIFANGTGSASVFLLVSGTVGYLTSFAILSSCYFFFVAEEG
jgi:hypothetical protein